jgi:hypothetical protein
MIAGPVLMLAVALVAMIALSATSRADVPREPTVSLIQLIANPASFDGKRVRLTGYVMLELENTAVYLHESDARYGITRNAVWLDVPLAGESGRLQFHQRYVFIEGIFSAERRGHRGLFGGALENIGRFEVVEPRPGPLVPAPH